MNRRYKQRGELTRLLKIYYESRVRTYRETNHRTRNQYVKYMRHVNKDNLPRLHIGIMQQVLIGK